MALPDGVTSATVTWAAPTDTLGEVGKWLLAQLTSDRDLVWTATSVTLYEQPADVAPRSATSLSATVPHVDQAGFVDTSGAAITNWAYTLVAEAEFPSGARRQYTKTFQVFTGQDSIALDLVADGEATAAVTAPAAAVLSVDGNTGNVTAQNLSDAVAPSVARRSFYNFFGSGLVAWEDAMRPDIANFSQFTEGYSAKSGHPITSDGAVNTNSILEIAGHRMRWTDGTPGGTPIRISKMVPNQEPTRIGGLACLSTQTTTLDTWDVNAASSTHLGVNAVIGCCVTSFAQGSVQLAAYQHGLMLFVVENPLVDPYYTPWSIAFDQRIPDDDTTPIAFYMDFDRPSSTITVHCPSQMEPVSITDPLFKTYWGQTFAWQERRSATTDGRVSYLAVGAGVSA